MVELRVGEGVKGFQAEIWTDIPNVLAVSLVSPSGEMIQKVLSARTVEMSIAFFWKRRRSSSITGFWWNVPIRADYPTVYRPAEGIWKIGLEPLQSIDGLFHIWLPVSEFLTGEVYFLRPSPDETMLEPGSTPSAITAAFYNWEENSVAVQSGRGYTRDRNIKPEFAVPGVNVTGAIPGGSFTERSGSSVGIAIAAGSAALLLQWIIQDQGARLPPHKFAIY